MNLLNQRPYVEIFSRGPFLVENVRDQYVFAAANRIGVDTDQTEQARDSCVDAFAEQFAVLADRFRRRGERLENRN